MAAVNENMGGFFFYMDLEEQKNLYLEDSISCHKLHLADCISLLPGGQTAHSRFVIPLNITEDSTCNLKQDFKRYYWLQRLTKSELPFGGKTIVLGGDFAQILPRDPKRIYGCKTVTLDTDLKELQEFSDWILAVGDGSIGNSFDGIDKVLIPKDLLITEYTDPIAAIVKVRIQILVLIVMMLIPTTKSHSCSDFDMVESINQYMISLNHNPEKSYLSSDKICKSDHTYSALEHTAGLCNGTRLIVTKLGNQVIEAKGFIRQMAEKSDKYKSSHYGDEMKLSMFIPLSLRYNLEMIQNEK
ncbi:hypothetical protein H5410_063931 [Solanum commersonii]|uniref:ATP-dependent DNA helicase n=1 Tax=Solanum commersonii TaxID=4109 RepID=A0A9J5WFB7_SOLCO|nr:hypothetical protein H5410_063931 [Solanum commersonii]